MADENCQNCKSKIEISIFKGTGHCCDNCRKVLSGEIQSPVRSAS